MTDKHAEPQGERVLAWLVETGADSLLIRNSPNWPGVFGDAKYKKTPLVAALSQGTRPTSGQAEGVRPDNWSEFDKLAAEVEGTPEFAQAREWARNALSPVDRSQPVGGALTDDDIKRARQVLARLCDHGLLTMSIPVDHSRDEDMLLSRVIDRAASAPALQAGELADIRMRLQNSVNWLMHGNRTGTCVGAGDFMKLIEWIGSMPCAPKGWKCLPVEPTEKMLAELFRGYTTREQAYAAMLSAAPSQAGAGEGASEQARWEAVVQLAHLLDDAAQGITERQAWDFASRFRLLAGLDGPEEVAAQIAALSGSAQSKEDGNG